MCPGDLALQGMHGSCEPGGQGKRSVVGADDISDQDLGSPVASVKRRASVPYWLMTSTGSTTFPMDLLIFLPCPSLTCTSSGMLREGPFSPRRIPNLKCLTRCARHPVTQNGADKVE